MYNSLHKMTVCHHKIFAKNTFLNKRLYNGAIVQGGQCTEAHKTLSGLVFIIFNEI